MSNQGPAGGDEVIEFDCRQIGSALVVCAPTGVSKAATALATALPADPARTVVVADFPPETGPQVWTALVAALHKRGPLRLAVSRAGSGNLSSPAQWLADQLQAEVVAPDGTLLPVPGGSTFVTNSHGAGCWFRFRPSHPPEPLGSRFPAPEWEPMIPGRPWPSGKVGIAEPIPAGLWLHATPSADGSGREHASAVFALPCRPDVLTVVLGGPEEPPLPPAEVRALLSLLPAPARIRVRIAPYGVAPLGEDYANQPLGQVLADVSGGHVAAYSGLPTAGPRGIDVVAYDAEGHPSWRPFTTELGYWPRTQSPAGAPRVMGFRPPATGLPMIGPGVYRLTDKAVIELVDSGLWIREPAEPAAAAVVRALPMDPMWARITVGVPGSPVSPELFTLATDLCAQLDLDTRRAVRLVLGDTEPSTPKRPPEAPVEPAVTVEPVVVAEPIAPAVSTAATEPEPDAALPAATEQAAGDTAAPVDVPAGAAADSVETVAGDHSSTQAERDWMRRTLGADYDSHAGAVLKMIARHPELRAPESESLEAAVTDLVAAQVYLMGSEQRMDAQLRTGDLDRLVAFVGCAVSGVRRLPCYEGAVLCWADVPATAGAVIRKTSFLNAISALDVDLSGGFEYLVWSVSGRRVDELGQTNDRVVFLPDTAFHVVAVGETRVLLAEDGAGDEALAKLERAAADRDMVPVRYRRHVSLAGLAEWPPATL
ncbi:MAG: hypothetical protein JOZ47_00145 [Kutzneria sp.]|nr:hypothetical protein [Kutzneria sp.]